MPQRMHQYNPSYFHPSLLSSPTNARNPQTCKIILSTRPRTTPLFVPRHVAANLRPFAQHSTAWHLSTRGSQSKQTRKILHAVTPFARASLSWLPCLKDTENLFLPLYSSIFSIHMETIAKGYRSNAEIQNPLGGRRLFNSRGVHFRRQTRFSARQVSQGLVNCFSNS